MKQAGPEAAALAQEWSAAALESHRSYLMRYARLQLRDEVAAEDAVQETLLAALQGSERYAGRAAVRTWLTGILKHKIIDHIRREHRDRSPAPAEIDGASPDADIADASFDADGHWREFPADWREPDRDLESKQFWAVFETCVQGMPERTARVFVMREVLELSTVEICRELGISAANCWVMLHRARLTLRACLETRWFQS